MVKALYIFTFLSLFNFSSGQNAGAESPEILGAHPEADASYPGGYAVLHRYVFENVTSKVTFTQEEASYLRKAFAAFTIDEKGNADSVRIVHSSNIPRLDNLLLMALKNMPGWTPATMNGKAIRQRYSFPLTICLK